MITVGETYLSSLYYVRDDDGVLANADVSIDLVLPDGSTDTAAPILEATGTYAFNYTTSQTGRHVFSVTATGQFLGATVLELGGDVFNVDDPDSTAVQLVGLAEAKAYLNIPESSSDDDEELRATIVSASSRVEAETQLWHRETVTEIVPAAGTLVLSKLPVVSVTSVTQTGQAATDATRYKLHAGTIVASPTGAALWPASLGDVTVVYEAGTSSVPSVIREAVLATVKHLWRAQRGPSRLPLSGAVEESTPPAGALPLDAAMLLRAHPKIAGVA